MNIQTHVRFFHGKGGKVPLRLFSLCFLLFIVGGYYSTGLVVRPVWAYSPTLQDNEGEDSPPFVEIIPAQNGVEIQIAGNLQSDQTDLFANVDSVQQTEDGPTGFKNSYTMTYSETETLNGYVATAVGFAPQFEISGTVNITSPMNLDTSKVPFKRVLLPTDLAGMIIVAPDGLLQLEAPNTATLGVDTYIAVTVNRTPPAPPPAGLRIIGNVYSVRAPATVPTADKAMLLRLYYESAAVQGIDLRTLALYAWDGRQWVNWGGRLLDAPFGDAPHVARGEVRDFAVYALMAANTWRDDFSDTDGLEELTLDQVMIDDEREPSALILEETPGRGAAVSLPISRTQATDHWSKVYYSAIAAPPTTTLQVDVVALDGTRLLTNVTSGDTLAAIDPALHPRLRLQAHLSSTVADQTPALLRWSVEWQPPDAQPAIVSAPDLNATVGQTLTAPIVITLPPDQELGGATVAVTYDPALLEAHGCVVETQQDAGLGVCNQESSPGDNNPAKVTSTVRFTILTSQPLSGTVPLATLTFQVRGFNNAGTALTVNPILVADPAGIALRAVGQAGQVTLTSPRSGDVNCDGAVDAGDGTLILRYEVGLVQTAAICPPPAGALFSAACDLNGDDSCDMRDALLILQADQ